MHGIARGNILTSVEHDFQVWVRPDGHSGDRYQLKYRMGTGKGLFRIQQRTGVTSTPASKSDVIPALTGAEVAQSTLLVSQNGRHSFVFAGNTIDRLRALQAAEWVLVQLTDTKQLEIPLPKRQEASTSHTPQSMPKVAATGMELDHIRYLENELIRTKKHVQELKDRIGELEDQIAELGGTVQPLILK